MPPKKKAYVNRSIHTASVPVEALRRLPVRAGARLAGGGRRVVALPPVDALADEAAVAADAVLVRVPLAPTAVH